MKIRVPATSANLGPGFDCLGIGLDFFNEIEIYKSKITSIKIKGEGQNNIYLKKNNIFVKIFYENYKKLSKNDMNFKFIFTNNIPFSRGLGSSSAVIVGALAAASVLNDEKINKEKLLNKAILYENHPDNIAPAIFGGFVCSVLHDNKVFSIKKDIDNNLKALIVIPNTTISTKKSRKNLIDNFTLKECVFNLSHSSFLTACFLEKKYDLLKIASLDMLHQNQRMSNMPELFEVQKIALENNALMSTLSGSGSSFLSIIHKDDAKYLEDKMKQKFHNFTIKTMNFNNNGFEFIEA